MRLYLHVCVMCAHVCYVCMVCDCVCCACVTVQAAAKNMNASIHKLDSESVRQQELVYTAEFQIQQMERKVCVCAFVYGDVFCVCERVCVCE